MGAHAADNRLLPLYIIPEKALSGFFLKKKPPPNDLEKPTCIPEML
jgi:hypothetical protein